MKTDTSERGLERLICTVLTGAPCDPPQPGVVQESTPAYTQGNLNVDRIGSRKIALPPKSEQHEIVRYVERRTAGLDDTIDHAQREIDLLREYRIRLIADVVTGKLDAREAAARLPEEEEEPEPLVDAEVLAESDEDGEGADLDTAPEEAEA